MQTYKKISHPRK